jgi:arylsulfatase A-like enzyme
MLALRLRIHARAPLPSTQPVPWLAAGLFEDIAVAGFVAALLLAFGRGARGERWTRLLFGAFAMLLLAAEVVWSEVLIFFGQLPSRDELLAGLNLTFARGSARGLALAGTAAFLLLFALLLRLSARSARHADRAWSNVPRLLSVAVVAGAAAIFVPISIHRRETAHDPAVALASVWREPSESEAKSESFFPAPRLDPAAIRELAPARPPRQYLGVQFPLAHRAPVRSASAPKLPAGLRPNLVCVLLESVRAEEVGAYGRNPPGVTPNLDRLAREGILVERAYSAGLQTPDAELALWYGVAPNPRASLMTGDPQARLTGLPEILRASGWRSFLWIHNGDQTFYRRDRFYRPRGFQMIDGRDFPSSDPRTGWGYSDRALARRAVDALDRASEPFAAEVLTVSNHHPFQVPGDARSHFPLLSGPRNGFLSFLGLDQSMGLQTAPMLQTVHYTDEAVGDFLRLAASRPWFSRTIFVVSGDHGLSIVPYQRPVETLPALTELRHRVPLILYSPLLAPARVPGPASQTDVLETFLGLSGIDLPRAGIGRDLLDRDQLDPGHPVVLWSAPGRLVTLVDGRRMYQASVPSEPTSTQPVHLSEEALIDPAADPDGKQNRLRAEPETAERYRRLVRAYVEIYPWILFSGRSGVPESPATLKAAGAR